MRTKNSHPGGRKPANSGRICGLSFSIGVPRKIPFDCFAVFLDGKLTIAIGYEILDAITDAKKPGYSILIKQAGSNMIPFRSNFIRYSTGLKHLLDYSSKQRLRKQFLLSPKPNRIQSPDIRDVADRLQRQLSELVPSTIASSCVFQKNVLLRLNHISGNIQDMVQGKLVFESTETWRSVYEEVLDSVKAKSYLSVALIKSDDYWRDQPGTASLEFNYRLIEHGFYIHRLFIIDDFFWAPSVQTPAKSLHNWITAQKHRGVDVTLVRLSTLDDDPHLVCDFGIYGEEAVGFQETDFQGRTTRFELHFDRQQLEKAKQHWDQLQLYSKSYGDVVTVR